MFEVTQAPTTHQPTTHPHSHIHTYTPYSQAAPNGSSPQHCTKTNSRLTSSHPQLGKTACFAKKEKKIARPRVTIANFFWIVRFGIGLLCDVSIVQPNLSIFRVHSRMWGVAGQMQVYRFSTVANVLADPSRFLLLDVRSKSNRPCKRNSL